MAYQYTSTETFNDNIEMDIGWIQFASCAEGDNPATINSEYTLDELLILAESAVTVKIMPSTDIPGVSETAAYTMKADFCSNPVYALNRGYTLSWVVDETTDPPVVIDYADEGNWIGATDLIWNSCYAGVTAVGEEPPTLADLYVYHACGNTEGLNASTFCRYGDMIYSINPFASKDYISEQTITTNVILIGKQQPNMISLSGLDLMQRKSAIAVMSKIVISEVCFIT